MPVVRFWDTRAHNRPVVYRGGNNDVSLLGEVDRGNKFATGSVNTYATWSFDRCANPLLLNSIVSPWLGR